MWNPFRPLYSRSADDIATIRSLEAENDRLCNEIATLRRVAARQRRKESREKATRTTHKSLKQYVGYRNYRNISPQFWPKALCMDCTHCVTHGKRGCTYHCGFHGFQVGKFSSCKNAFPKRISIDERVA